jgi:hypothetical protein
VAGQDYLFLVNKDSLIPEGIENVIGVDSCLCITEISF